MSDRSNAQIIAEALRALGAFRDGLAGAVVHALEAEGRLTPARHDHSKEPKVWCETHQHTHVASIPRFTYQCKACGWGQWYAPDARAHEESCLGHETYEVEHVVRPIAEGRLTPAVQGDAKLLQNSDEREALAKLLYESAPEGGRQGIEWHEWEAMEAESGHTFVRDSYRKQADAILAAGWRRG